MGNKAKRTVRSVCRPPRVPEQPIPWNVYRADRVRPGQWPQNQVFVSTHASAREAMDEADRLKAGDPRHSYVVGG